MKPVILAIAFVWAILSGCGKSTILVNDPHVEIYVNNEYKGKGSAEIRRTGIPKKIEIEAKYHNKQIGYLIEKRRFKFSTCLIGYFTYGVGLLTCWKYPELIFVPVDLPKSLKYIEGKSTWDKPENSVWDEKPK